jgi:hypothetical protein
MPEIFQYFAILSLGLIGIYLIRYVWLRYQRRKDAEALARALKAEEASR